MMARVRPTTALVTGALAALLLLAGCAAPAPEPRPTPTASPVVTPTATPSTPSVAFDGECGEMFADAAFSALTGLDMTLAEPGWVIDDAGRLGGVDCLWVSDPMGFGSQVSVEVFPIVSVPESRRVPESVSDCPQTYFCVATGESDGMWVSARISGEAPLQETVEQLRDAVLTKLESRVDPVPSADRSGWWSLPDCADLGDLDGWTVSDHETDPSLRRWLADEAGMSRQCDLIGYIDDVRTGTTIEFHPGGAPDLDSAAAVREAREIDVEGAVRAVVTMDPDPIEPLDQRLVVSDGTNELIIKIPLGFGPEDIVPEDFAPVASKLLAAMAD